VKALVAAAVVASTLAAGASAGGAWRTVADPGGGYSLAVPRAWQVVPRETPQLTALVARLRRTKQTALANQFAEVAAARRLTHPLYRFQAFAWPPPKGAVVPDVTVKTDPLSAGTTAAALPAIAREIVKALSGTKGATASAPVRSTLPAGTAVSVTGTTQISKSVRSRYAIYLLIHAKTLYSISFRGPATAAERGIVERFRFS
jgi:hypothetical protein